MEHSHCTAPIREPWNKGKIVGQKAPLRLKEIWAIRGNRPGKSSSDRVGIA